VTFAGDQHGPQPAAAGAGDISGRQAVLGGEQPHDRAVLAVRSNRTQQGRSAEVHRR